MSNVIKSNFIIATLVLTNLNLELVFHCHSILESSMEVTIEQMQSNAIEASELLKVIAHPERLLVVCQLSKGELGVGELAKLSSLSQSAFSQHLTVLRKHGIISARKESQSVFYSLADERVTVIVESLYTIFCQE